MKHIELLPHFLILSTILSVNRVSARLKAEGIVGGDDAKEGEFGYPVSVQVYDRHWCGGAIVAELYVVSAAHCFVGTDNEFNRNWRLTVVAGVSDLHIDSPRKVTIEVKDIFVPSEYDRRVMVNRVGDIAVLKLKEAFNIKRRSYLRKLVLPKEDESFSKVTTVLTGYGINEVEIAYNPETHGEEIVGMQSFDKMRYAKVHVEAERAKTLDASIVQRDPSKPEGTCGGDSGSPLVYKKILIGVVSAGAGDCRDDRQPTLYTRVASYVKFIRNVLNGNIGKDIRHNIVHNVQY